MKNSRWAKRFLIAASTAAVLVSVVDPVPLAAQAPRQRPARVGARLGGAAGAGKIGSDAVLIALVGAAATSAALVVVLDKSDRAASPGS